MKPIVILLIFTLLFFACRTTEGYRNKVSQWIGNTETDLLTSSEWGVPNGTYELEDGTKLFMYSNQKIGSLPVYNGNQNNYNYIPVSRECKTTFFLKNKKIIDVNFQGNDCKD